MVSQPVSPCPAVVIAAPSSSSGKTTIATGLIGALSQAGLDVAPFKVGPDYIDPGYHTLAAVVGRQNGGCSPSARPGRNLDSNMVGDDLIGPLFLHGSSGADIAVIEGVMGLFDGRVDDDSAVDPPIPSGSTAHIAQLLGAPIILVVDVRGMSQSLAALLAGFVGYAPELRIAGVVANNVGSARHASIAERAAATAGIPLLGAMRRDSSVSLGSRHLGLVTAAENGSSARDSVTSMAQLVASAMDLDRVLAIADSAPRGLPWSPSVVGQAVNPVPTIAVLAGRAFGFEYTEHRELLTAAGAIVVEVDPIADKLPQPCHGVVIPGGFPEEHAAELASNSAMREAVHANSRAGMPIHAECAGLIYLCQDLDGTGMAGVLPYRARFTKKLKLGYRNAVAVAESALAEPGTRVVGHEFHRTEIFQDTATSQSDCVELQGVDSPAWMWKSPTGESVADGVATATVHASYLHTHPAAAPAMVAKFVSACADFAKIVDSSGPQTDFSPATTPGS